MRSIVVQKDDCTLNEGTDLSVCGRILLRCQWQRERHDVIGKTCRDEGEGGRDDFYWSRFSWN